MVSHGQSNYLCAIYNYLCKFNNYLNTFSLSLKVVKAIQIGFFFIFAILFYYEQYGMVDIKISQTAISSVLIITTLVIVPCAYNYSKEDKEVKLNSLHLIIAFVAILNGYLFVKLSVMEKFFPQHISLYYIIFFLSSAAVSYSMPLLISFLTAFLFMSEKIGLFGVDIYWALKISEYDNTLLWVILILNCIIIGASYRNNIVRIFLELILSVILLFLLQINLKAIDILSHFPEISLKINDIGLYCKGFIKIILSLIFISIFIDKFILKQKTLKIVSYVGALLICVSPIFLLTSAKAEREEINNDIFIGQSKYIEMAVENEKYHQSNDAIKNYRYAALSGSSRGMYKFAAYAIEESDINLDKIKECINYLYLSSIMGNVDALHLLNLYMRDKEAFDTIFNKNKKFELKEPTRLLLLTYLGQLCAIDIGCGGWSGITADQREAFKKRGKEWLVEAAKHDVPEAYLALAVLGLLENRPGDAKFYFTRAAERKSATAYYYLGCCAYKGLLDEKANVQEAVNYFRKSIQFGNIEARFMYAKAILSAPEFRDNFDLQKEGQRIFDVLLGEEYPPAKLEYARQMLFSPGKSESDIKKAIATLKEFSAFGDEFLSSNKEILNSMGLAFAPHLFLNEVILANFYLGKFYMTDERGYKDFKVGKYYIRKAIKFRHNPAEKLLASFNLYNSVTQDIDLWGRKIEKHMNFSKEVHYE